MAVCGSCFCGIDHTDSPYGYCWLPIRRGKNICLLSGNDLVMADLPFGPLSGEGERTGKYRPEEIVRICCQPSRRFRHIPYIWFFGCTDLVGAACRAAGFIFVDNSTPKAAARSVLEAERSLKNGASVVVFPEGSRTYNGKMIRFKKGAYQMAADQHLQIVPITLNGPFDVLPIGSLNIHRHKMEMVIHPPIPTEGMDASHKGLQQMADKTQDIIASALWEQYK